MSTRKRSAQAEAPATRRVWPHPDLAERGENLPGVGVDGADVPVDLAAEWIKAGLALPHPPSTD